jgi:hypothetical protein
MVPLNVSFLLILAFDAHTLKHLGGFGVDGTAAAVTGTADFVPGTKSVQRKLSLRPRGTTRLAALVMSLATGAAAAVLNWHAANSQVMPERTLLAIDTRPPVQVAAPDSTTVESLHADASDPKVPLIQAANVRAMTRTFIYDFADEDGVKPGGDEMPQMCHKCGQGWWIKWEIERSRGGG